MERDRYRIGALRSSARGGGGGGGGGGGEGGERMVEIERKRERVEMGMAKIGSCGSRSVARDNGGRVRGENWQFLSG